MKTRIYIAMVVGVALLLAVVWWLRTSKQVPRIEHTAQVSGVAGSTTSTVARNFSLPIATNQSSEATLSDKVRAYQQGLISKAEVMKQMWATENAKPQDFYGKVIDQSGRPVANVGVTGNLLRIRGWDVGEEKQVYHTTSDIAGLFEFTNLKGWQLGVTVKKEGYQMDERGKGYKGPTNGEKTSPSDRAVLTMWKLKGPEPMVHSKIHAYIPCDGTVVSYDLLTGKKANGEGDLTVKLLRNPINIVRGKSFDWSATLEIPNGGMAEIADLYPNEAPADGYQSSITTNMSTDMKNWSYDLKHSFYFKSRSGQFYGRMTIDIGANFQPPPTLFDADIYVNPSGSRNLEYDRTKEIEPGQVVPKQATR